MVKHLQFSELDGSSPGQRHISVPPNWLRRKPGSSYFVSGLVFNQLSAQ